MPANYVNAGYTTYGSGPCPRCNKKHELKDQIKEQSKARFIAMRLIAELAMVPASSQGAKSWQDGKTKQEKLALLKSKGFGAITDDHIFILDFVFGSTAISMAPTEVNLKAYALARRGMKDKTVATYLKELVKLRMITVENGYLRGISGTPMMPVVAVGAGKKFMIGVLVADKKIFVAASGSNLTRIEAAAKSLSRSLGTVVLCEARTAQGIHKTWGGADVASAEYLQTKVDNEPGTCAAPRVVEKAMADADAVKVRDNWQMTEVWFDPNAEADESYVHGLSAKHCNTCDKLIPLLLCPVKPG